MNDTQTKTIKMVDTENVSTSRGPVQYKRGEIYTVELWIADSLIGRGMATEVLSESDVSQPSPQALVFDLELLKTMRIDELRDTAKGFGLEGWDTKKKEALKAAISDYVLEQRGEPLEPPKEPIEILPPPAQPPEFKKDE